MSLYIFNVSKDSATVSADSRMCVTVDGEQYRLHDRAQKLHIIYGMIITLGGVAWVGERILSRFRNVGNADINALHRITLDALSEIESTGKLEGIQLGEEYKSNPYFIEICCLKYQPQFGHNFFHQIATSNGYKLFSLPVDGVFRDKMVAYGGIDIDIAKTYFHDHPDEIEHDYTSALLNAYTAASSEKIGGNLTVVTQDKNTIGIQQFSLTDKQPIKDYLPVLGVQVVGSKLQIESYGDREGVKSFQFDARGAFLDNATMTMRSNNGKILFDPRYGIVGGTKDIFSVEGTNVKPSFIDKDGKIVLDKDGIPENSNFFLDVNTGAAFLRGTIYAKDGKFDGIVQAKDYLDQTGKSMLTSDHKFDSAHLDLGNIQLDGITGDITMTGSINLSGASNINWGGNSPIKSQFSQAYSGPWHDTMQTTDVYRRDWNWLNDSWGSPYQYKGTDGANGSDANVTYANIRNALQQAAGTQTTFITADELGSPNIYGGKIYGAKIYAGAPNTGLGAMLELTSDGFAVWKDVNRLLTIAPSLTDWGEGVQLTTGYNPLTMSAPEMHIGLGSTQLWLGSISSNVSPYGSWDFSKARNIIWGNNAPTAVFG